MPNGIFHSQNSDQIAIFHDRDRRINHFGKKMGQKLISRRRRRRRRRRVAALSKFTGKSANRAIFPAFVAFTYDTTASESERRATRHLEPQPQ